MNKELIKKYKKEFDYMLDGGEIVYSFKDNRKFYNLTWNEPIDDISYIVINDSYSDYRKALAEGKTVQYYECVYINEMCCVLDKYEWMDLQTSIFDKPVKSYRIKPEEPQFKIGDFIRQGSLVIRIHGLSSSGYWDIKNTFIYKEDAIKWEPQPGEWCWFYDKKDLGNRTNTVIARFSHMYQKYYATSHLIDNGYFENCEPFIGTLPTHL